VTSNWKGKFNKKKNCTHLRKRKITHEWNFSENTKKKKLKKKKKKKKGCSSIFNLLPN
jgi:hypothetical protein